MSAYDPEKMIEHRKLNHDAMRDEFARRESKQRKSFEPVPVVVNLDSD